jgi:hypothetical protein
VQEAYNERIEKAAREGLPDPTRLNPGEYGTAVDSVDEGVQVDQGTPN